MIDPEIVMKRIVTEILRDFGVVFDDQDIEDFLEALHQRGYVIGREIDAKPISEVTE
jgi:hypothetical protein